MMSPPLSAVIGKVQTDAGAAQDHRRRIVAGIVISAISGVVKTSADGYGKRDKDQKE